jgi:hypothetical protein
MRFPDEKNININGQQGYIKNYCKDGNFYIEKFVNGMESPSLIKGHSFQDFIYFYGEEIISSPSLTKKRYRYVCTTLVA